MNNYINQKESIILSAIDIIDELGFQGLLIIEICRRENVTEENLYQYYQSKGHVERLR